ncbi:MAG: hypothetical protein TQ35_0005330 [Candidatus Aramenus sulfurataquae]|uniref:TRASH domain-containing protein n=2 Tax=Candidatus Aramenus sulfurataquae TaxID=1326980 RepID=A0A0F2LNQ7_9CREN|nr:hypothetical protein [Candidatus Aramenus sulfurataquae]
MRQKFLCLVCGRSFYEGQGVVITIADRKLEFHSKACAYKFFKNVLENADKDCISSAVKDVYKKFSESLEKRKIEKKI